MRRSINILLLFMLFFYSLYLYGSAEHIINPDGVEYKVDHNDPIYNIRYDVLVVYLDITAVDGSMHTISLAVDNSIYNNNTINISRERIENALGFNGKAILNPIIAGAGGNIKTRAEIKIFNATTREPLAYFRQESDIENVARDKFGFSNTPPPNNPNGNGDLENMHKWFNYDILSMLVSHPGKPQTGENHMTFVASLQEPNNIDNPVKDSWLTSTIDFLKIKSGYGIPIIAELQGFQFLPKIGECGEKSTLDSFQIENVEVKVETDFGGWGNDNNNYWITNGVSGINMLEAFSKPYKLNQSWARFTLLKNTNYPLGRRKLYTNPSQKDETYTIRVTADTKTSWVEGNVHRGCYYVTTLTGGYWVHKIYTLYHNESTGDEYRFINTKDLKIQIKDSMFDDDQTIIFR